MQDVLTGFDYSPPPASRTKRWIACFIDYILYLILFVTGCYLFGEPVINKYGDVVWELHGFKGFLGIIIPWLFLFPVIECFNSGRTIGKALFRIKTLRDDFSDLDFMGALIRHLCDIIDFMPLFGIIGMLVTTRNKYHQRIGDLVAKTVVIDATYKPQTYTHRKVYK